MGCGSAVWCGGNINCVQRAFARWLVVYEQGAGRGFVVREGKGEEVVAAGNSETEREKIRLKRRLGRKRGMVDVGGRWCW